MERMFDHDGYQTIPNSTATPFRPTTHVITLALASIVLITAVIVGVCGNLSVLVSYKQSCHVHKTNHIDALVASMAIADLIICLLFAPILLHVLYNWANSNVALCGAMLYFGSCAGMISIITIDIIALHRQYRVTRNTEGEVSKCQAGATIAGLWLICAAITVGQIFYVDSVNVSNRSRCAALVSSGKEANFFLYLLLPLCYTSFAIVMISYGIIGHAIYKMSKGGTLSISTSNGTRKVTPENAPADRLDPYNKLLTCDKQKKALGICVLTVITFLFCYGPLVLAQTIEARFGEYNSVYQMKVFGIALTTLNSALNPHLYGYFSFASRSTCINWYICTLCAVDDDVTDTKPSGTGSAVTRRNSTPSDLGTISNAGGEPGRVDRAAGPSTEYWRDPSSTHILENNVVYYI